MKRLYFILYILTLGLAAFGAEKSFSIEFGAKTSSINSLTSSNFIETAVKGGKGYISGVTSVVNVFPEVDGIKLSSSSKNGKFNIALTEEAQVVATKIVVTAKRYDNNRDSEANILLNSEAIDIPSIEWEDYVLAVPSLSRKLVTNLIVDAEKRLYISAITIYYDASDGDVTGPLETVETPEFIPGEGNVTAGTQISISCPTSGASIYYTIDGAIPTTASSLYEAPIEVYNDLTLRAFAVKSGMNPSGMAEAVYKVRNPEAYLEATFDFANPLSLNPSVQPPAEKDYVELDGRSFSDGDVVITFEANPTNNTHARLFHSYDAGIDLRLYDGDIMNVAVANTSLSISEIQFTMSMSGATTGTNDINFIPSSGDFDWAAEHWTADEDSPVQSVDLTSAMQSRISSMTVTLDRLSGIMGLPTDHDHSAVYFTIMGQRVTALTLKPGFYIKLADGKARKVYVHSHSTH